MRGPARIPIVYLIGGILLLVSVVPMYFYASRVTASNRERLRTNEMLLQNTITRSLGDDIGVRQNNFRIMLANFSSVVEVASGGSLAGDRIATPQLRTLMQKFVTESPEIAYATLVNGDEKGISAGRVQLDGFMNSDLGRALQAARSGNPYTGQALSTGSGANAQTLLLVSSPVVIGGQFQGMIAAFIDLNFLVERLRDASRGGLVTYVVDRSGRLIASGDTEQPTGRDMTSTDIVKAFVDQGGKARLADTREFSLDQDGDRVPMLGTYTPVASLGWAVIAQKPQRDAYQAIREMQWTAGLLAVFAVIVCIIISITAARKIATPLEILTERSRAIARGDFSQRVRLRSRTEIGELANTFNFMSSELEKFVADLKRAAEENRALFLSSIQMLAGAVDEKDPYTRGHSDRVTRYSVAIAQELGLESEEIEKVRVAAQLHDVGKIGIEDRILKKPGALTPEEYEVMKTHTTKGANILRSVRQLKDMIPGIELHHESLDGRGYPYGLKGEEVPIMARIIMVADCFDAMTTDRPYQKASEPEYVLKTINGLGGTKFDPKVTSAISAVFERGELMPRRVKSAGAAETASV